MFLLFIIGFSVCSAFNPGVTASIDMGVIEEAKNNYFEYILNALVDTPIPDIKFDGGRLYKNKFIVKSDEM